MKRGGRVGATLAALAAVGLGVGALAVANRADRSTPPTTLAETLPPGPTTSTTAPFGAAGAPAAAQLAFGFPPGARFVGQLGDDGADGSASAPWRTIQHAIDETPDGGTIVVHGGVYREALVVRHKTLTIQSFPHESVFVRGADPVQPQPDGSGTWQVDGWTARFPRQHADWTTHDHPMANAPDMVFVDGQSLRQVASRRDVRGATFYVDRARSALVIGTDPAGHVVEAARRTTGLLLDDAPRSVVRGITFDRFATPLDGIAAVVDKSVGVTFDADVFADNATGGLSVLAADGVVRNCSMLRNGQLGLHAYRADRLLVDGSWFGDDNAEHFSTQVQAGGAKISDSDAVTIRNSRASDNDGDGIWFDLGARHAVVVHDEVSANTGDGIQYEISSDAIIGANVAVDNQGNGVRVLESQRVDVVNNTFVRNGRGVEVLEGGRPQNVAAVRLLDNLFYDARKDSVSQFAVDDATHTHTAAQMGVTADGDAFVRREESFPPYVVVWADGTAVSARYLSLTLFTDATGQDRHGRTADRVALTSLFAAAAHDDYTLLATSPYASGGVALPPDVRAAIGAPDATAAAPAVGAFAAP